VSVDWHNALSVLDDMWFLNPFYLAFASKPRVFAFGSRVVQAVFVRSVQNLAVAA
jgi:hypothetical protein